MPVKKGKSCVGDVMKEWKRGDLHSGTGKKGKKGPVVKSQDQAIAIALNTCNNNEMDDQKYSEDITPMLVSRLRVIVGRCQEILQVLDHASMSAKMGGGEVEMDQWMVDKITMAADYLSAVADNAKFGGGVEVEMEYGEGCGCDSCPQCEAKKKMMALGYSEEAVNAIMGEMEEKYGEKKGLWANIHAKRERIKRGSGERMRKPGEKGAPSAADIKAAGADDDKKK